MNRFLCTVLMLIAVFYAPTFAQKGIDLSVPLRTFNPTGEAPNVWALDPAKNIMYVASLHRITAHRIDTGAIVQTYSGLCADNENLQIWRLEPHQSHLLVSCAEPDRIFYGLAYSIIINTQTAKVISKIISTIATTSDDLNIFALISTCPDGECNVIEIRNGAKTNQINIFSGYNSYFKSMRLTNDGTRLLILSSNSVIIWDVKASEKIATIPIPSQDAIAARLSDDGKTLVVLSEGNFDIFQLPENTLLFSGRLPSRDWDRVAGIQLASDGDRVIVSGLDFPYHDQDFTIVYSLVKGGIQQTLKASAVGFTNDGHYLVTLGEKGFSVLGSDTRNVWLRESVAVLVNSNQPDARVSVDGVDRGLASGDGGDLKLYLGSYNLTVSAPGFRSQTQKITVVDGKPLSLNISLERMRGSVRFESTPSGAAVNLDGKRIGVTPITINNLDLGSHQYSLSLEDHFDANDTVSLSDENPQTVRIALTEVPGLVFNSTPSGATISVDGTPVGITPITARNLKPGRVTFTAVLAGYQTFTGRAIVPETGKGAVEISLSKTTSLILPSQPEAQNLQFDQKALDTARQGLIRVNDMPMLPIPALTALTGIGVYGDTSHITLAWGRLEVALTIGEPTKAKPTLFVKDAVMYAPLVGLEKLGLRLMQTKTVVLALNDDRVDLGIPKSVFATESVVAPLRAPWRAALEKAIVLDNAPAFAVRDLLSFVKGLSYQPESLTLFLNGKPLLRAFKPASGGVKGSLVIYKGGAYLPSALLPLIGLGSRFNAPTLTLTVAEIPFDLRFATAGRDMITTIGLIRARDEAVRIAEAKRKAEATRVAKLNARERARLKGVAATLRNRFGATFVYLGNDQWGSAVTLGSNAPFAFISIVYAPNSNSGTWRRCTWESRENIEVNNGGSYGNGVFVVEFLTSYGRVLGTFVYAPGTCNIVAAY
jgi:PEGA domain